MVTITGKGMITYSYEAAGNKLQKTTLDQTVVPNKTTIYTYAGDYVYRNGGTTDTLEFVTMPEGRLRPARIDTTQAISIANLKYIYDYLLKDHLGNTRATLTKEQETDIYAATMETANATKENALFNNVSSTATNVPAGFTNDPNNKMASKLNGNINTNGNKRVGPSIILKVMTGDTISISVNSWYTGAVQPAATGVTAITNDLLPLLTNGIGAENGSKGGAIPTAFTGPYMSADITTMIQTDSSSYSTARPKAFLNWMVVGEDYIAATSSPNHVGTVQIPVCNAGDTLKQIVGLNGLVCRRNGWIYIYVSNESNQDVYFDNLVINFKHGPLVEQEAYFPFGMDNPALSTQAIKQSYNQNRYKYNGIEYDTAFGLNEYEAHFRNLDPTTCRWTTIDPSPNVSETPYSSMGNNPISKMDPLGDTLVFPDASQDFVDQFYDAYSDLDAHGVGDVLTGLQNLSNYINVVEWNTPENDNNPSHFNQTNNTIYWDPHSGLTTDEGITLSPTTMLDHEASHGLQFNENPTQFAKDIDSKTGSDKEYDNKEDRRVITTREQKVANALGEIKKGQVTRRNHGGSPERVKNPTSTKPLVEDEMLQRLKDEQKFKKDNLKPERKNPCIGCDGPCCGAEPKKENTNP